MSHHVMIPTHTAIVKIHGLLDKIDRLCLPETSRRDVESILVRQASREIDRALPRQAGHGRRTAATAIILGQAAGLNASAAHQLKLAAYLHDIGLLTLPDLLAEGRSQHDPEDYITIQNHPRLGAQVLEPFSFLRDASVIIAHHHERWDGTGYPYGIRGPFIPWEARILSVADAFDAIEVPGADSLDLRNHVAYRIIRVGAGTQFDPSIVTLLGDALENRAITARMERVDD